MFTWPKAKAQQSSQGFRVVLTVILFQELYLLLGREDSLVRQSINGHVITTKFIRVETE